MGPIVFRDGIFSQADPLQPGGYLTAYNDGSLGNNRAMRKVRRRAPGPMRIVRRRSTRGVGFFGEGFTPWADRSATSKAQVLGVLGGGAAAGYLLARIAGAKPNMAGLGAAAGGAVAYLVGSSVAKGT